MSLKELKRFIIVHGEKPYKDVNRIRNFLKDSKKQSNLLIKKPLMELW